MTNFEIIAVIVGCISVPIFLIEIYKKYERDMKEMNKIRRDERKQVHIEKKKIKLHL